MSTPSVSEVLDSRVLPRRLPSPLWWSIASGCLLILALSVYWVWAGLWTAKGLYLEDFRSYVATGDAVLHGAPLYEPGVSHLPTIGGTFKYTPFAGLAFTLLTLVPGLLLPLVATLVNLGALFAVVWVSFGRQGYARDQGRVAATVALTAFCFALQPVLANFSAGQVNLILMALVLLDLTGRNRPWTGVGVGIAAGVKLIPGFFILYLLVTKQFKAAGVAVGAFVLTMAVGFVALPDDSKTFWAANLVDPSRITGDGDASAAENQSVRGAMARLVGIADVPNVVWLPVALLVGVAGLVIAVRAHRAGRELLAVSVVGATMVLLSPMTWSHYWVWFIPFLAMGVGAALRARKWLPWVVATAGYLLVFSWPVDRGRGDVPVVGLVVLPERFPLALQVPAHALYVVLALALLVLSAVRPNWLNPRDDEFVAKA